MKESEIVRESENERERERARTRERERESDKILKTFKTKRSKKEH